MPRWSQLSRRWEEPAHPLYLALVFQVLTILVITLGVPYAAVGFVGGTVGCVVASLRLQRRLPQPT